MIPIVLKVYDGGKLKVSRTFQTERIRLGSMAADLILDGPAIASTHAVIEAGAHGVVIRATCSAPVYLNGQPILAAPLRHGDLVSIGDIRVMVELRPSSNPQLPPGQQKRRPQFQVIVNENEPGAENAHPHVHAVPSLSLVRESTTPVEVTIDAAPIADNAPVPVPEVETPVPVVVVPPPVVVTPAPVAPPPVVVTPVPVAPPPALVVTPAPVEAPPQQARPQAAQPKKLPPLHRNAVQGGDCAEVEMFWGDTRVGVWQLMPGDHFVAGSAHGCNALVSGIERAALLTSDVNGWTVAAPRQLALTLEEEGRTLGGPELLVRGRSQAGRDGLILPLQPLSVAVLHAGNISLRIRRVPGADRAGVEQHDIKGVLAASVAAVLMMVAMRIWSGTVPPARILADAEVIRPRPLAVRTVVKEPVPVKATDKGNNQARRDPGKAVARHMGQEGQAGSKTAPRKDARAERKADDRAIVAQTGLLKALGAGKGASDVFGVALEKGAKDAMGHLTGPKVADAHGDGGMGLKSLGGHGGGGDGSGLGLARIGTNGIGGGLADYGNGKGGLRGKEDGDIGLGPGKPQVVGSIDPELIRKVVHEHRAQIRNCYETQLNTKPSLAGKVVAAWTIDQSGAVTETHTQESTMHDKTVEACVNSKIKTWRFPIPKGGGEVFVTYPFIFTPGG